MNYREQAREYFVNNNLSYSDIEMNDLYKLISFLNKLMFDDEILIMMNEPKLRGPNKNIKLNKKNRVIFAELRCKGTYFCDREAITFNEDGFIGFCGWADDKRASIITTAFIYWCDYLKNKK